MMPVKGFVVRRALKDYEYAVSLLNANAALERVLKTLLDRLAISYMKKMGKVICELLLTV